MLLRDVSAWSKQNKILHDINFLKNELIHFNNNSNDSKATVDQHKQAYYTIIKPNKVFSDRKTQKS